MQNKGPSMIATFYMALSFIACVCLIMLTLLPPQQRAVGAATRRPSDTVAYFQKLSEIGQTKTSLSQENRMITIRATSTTTTTTTVAPIVKKSVTTTQPQVTAPPAPQGGNCDLVLNYDWPQATALRICNAESHGNANALNTRDDHGKCRGSYGLMQIACFWFPFYGYEITFDPQINIDIAYKIWQRQGGFTAWSTY